MNDVQPSSRQLWYAVHSTSGLGSVAAQRLATALRDASLAVEDLLHRTPEELRDGFGLSHSLAHALAHELEHAWNLRVDDAELLLPGDESYPNGRFLEAVPPLPVALWAMGHRSLLDNQRPALGVSGSRDAVDELLELTHRLAGSAATKGWDVVSGLSAGVDNAAHQGAVDAGGSTIGVLANGLSVRSSSWQPENLDDVLDRFEPYECYWERHHAMGETDQAIAASFVSIIDNNRSTCLYKRDQWLVPRFMGVERRVRQRTTDAVSTSRSVAINDANELQQRMQSGLESLRRFANSAPAPLMVTPYPAPETASRPEDQPQLVTPPSVIAAAIAREAGATTKI